MSQIRVTPKSKATRQGFDPTRKEIIQRVGQHPVKDKNVKGVRLLREWQDKAFRTLQSAPLGMLIAPTGSGKSVVQKGLAYLRLMAGEKVVIAVPETTIAGSFDTEKNIYKLSDGTEMHWEVAPENFLFGDTSPTEEKSRVKRLISFVTEKAAGTVAKRVLVCTHATLVRAHKELIKQKSYRKSPWAGTNVFVDECHHSRYVDEENDREESANNEMGEFVRHFVKSNAGRLLLSTATWLRGDALSIVPTEYEKNFVPYSLPIDEYLDGLEHLKEIVFKFSVGEYATVLKEEIKANPHAKTLVYLPPVTTNTVHEKIPTLRKFQTALGASKLNGDVLFHKSSGLTSLDLVTEAGRDKRKTFLENAKGTAKCPNVVFVQNLFREGSDLPEAARSLVMGPRGTLTMLIQMIGRLLRDFPKKRRVEFHMVLPKDMMTDVEQFTVYTNAVFMVMALGWQLGSAKKGRLSSAEVLHRVMGEVNKKTLEASDSTSSEGEMMREALLAVLPDLTEEEAKSIPHLLDGLRGAFRLAANAARHLMGSDDIKTFGKDVDRNVFKGGHGLWATQFGAENFRALRERHIGLPEVTPEYVSQLLVLERCLYFKEKGVRVDPRKLKGAVELFGSREALEKACQENGL